PASTPAPTAAATSSDRRARCRPDPPACSYPRLSSAAASTLTALILLSPLSSQTTTPRPFGPRPTRTFCGSVTPVASTLALVQCAPVLDAEASIRSWMSSYQATTRRPSEDCPRPSPISGVRPSFPKRIACRGPKRCVLGLKRRA